MPSNLGLLTMDAKAAEGLDGGGHARPDVAAVHSAQCSIAASMRKAVDGREKAIHEGSRHYGALGPLADVEEQLTAKSGNGEPNGADR